MTLPFGVRKGARRRNILNSGTKKQHLRVRLNGAAPRQWHLRLLQRLTERDDSILSIDARPEAGLPPNVEHLFRLERTIHGLSYAGLAAPAERAALSNFMVDDASPSDLIIDLCGDVPAGPCPVWRLAFDDLAGEPGLVASLLDARAPLASIRTLEGKTIAAARLGTESGGIALSSFEECLARTITLLLAALSGAASAGPSTILGEPALEPPTIGLAHGPLARRSTKVIARAMLRGLYYRLYHAPHWRVGWRKLAGPDLVDLRAHPGSGWTDLPDDGSRFYADPFPIERAGVVTLFVEDYSHSLGRGIISAVTFGPDGPLGRPEPVLDLGYHLSYPFVFERDGEVWMIPESCAVGRVDLFRATAFPKGWVLEKTLVPDVIASDATIHQIDGRWWMFATVRDQGGAFSDSLHLWSAPDFRGPWRPHAGNPVLIDIATARPAGRIVERNGIHYRPVQDCRTGYGAALGLARIIRLDDKGFDQIVETVLRPGPRWPGRRLHTLNAAGGLEFIDGSGEARRRLLPIKTTNHSS